MDEIDLIILRKLLENSRLTFRELADITNMSVSAVHKYFYSIPKFQLNGIYFGILSSNIYSFKRKNTDFIDFLDLFIILKFLNFIPFI